MAFMMPVMKKNYNIYADPNIKIVAKDSKGKKVQITNAKAIPRRVRSEGPSLSASPGESMSIRVPKGSGSKTVILRPARGSAPALSTGTTSYYKHSLQNSSKSSVTVGSAPTKRTSSPTHSTGSSASSGSSGSEKGSHGFHNKLLARLRKSLRIKDPAPAVS